MLRVCDLGYISKPLPDAVVVHCHKFTVGTVGHVTAAMCAMAACEYNRIIEPLGLDGIS